MTYGDHVLSGFFFQILLRRSSGRDSRLGSWKDSERRRERKGPQPWPKRLSDSSITPHISILRPSVSVTFDEWGPDSAFPKHVTPLYPGAGETHIRWCLHENLCFLLVCKWGRAELEQGHDHVTYCQRSHVADCHHFIISSSGTIILDSDLFAFRPVFQEFKSLKRYLFTALAVLIIPENFSQRKCGAAA